MIIDRQLLVWECKIRVLNRTRTKPRLTELRCGSPVTAQLSQTGSKISMWVGLINFSKEDEIREEKTFHVTSYIFIQNQVEYLKNDEPDNTVSLW